MRTIPRIGAPLRKHVDLQTGGAYGHSHLSSKPEQSPTDGVNKSVLGSPTITKEATAGGGVISYPNTPASGVVRNSNTVDRMLESALAVATPHNRYNVYSAAAQRARANGESTPAGASTYGAGASTPAHGSILKRGSDWDSYNENLRRSDRDIITKQVDRKLADRFLTPQAKYNYKRDHKNTDVAEIAGFGDSKVNELFSDYMMTPSRFNFRSVTGARVRTAPDGSQQVAAPSIFMNRDGSKIEDEEEV